MASQCCRERAILYVSRMGRSPRLWSADDNCRTALKGRGSARRPFGTWAGPGQAEALSVSLSALRAEIAAFRQEVNRAFRDVRAEMAGIKSSVSALETDVAGLKADVAGLKSDMTDVKGAPEEILRRLPPAASPAA